MTEKENRYFECSNCGHQEVKWNGRCSSCSQWNTLTEMRNSGAIHRGGKKKSSKQEEVFLALNDICLDNSLRIRSGIHEFDRVLGGGVLQSSSILFGGEPGIGKSTLMIQAAAAYSSQGTVLYVSGEEAPEQIKLRAVRLGIGDASIHLLVTTFVEEIVSRIYKTAPLVIIFDSIQTLSCSDSTGSPGSPTQIRSSVQCIIEAARAVNACSFFIAHVTKEGNIAGPKVIEHLVDAVLFFDYSDKDLRFLRASKNRFGSTNEIGLFEMEENGLREVNNAERLFLSESEENTGMAIVPVYEGSRVLMVEIQALTVPGQGGYGRVYSDKIDQRRVSRIAAVLEKHASMKLSDQDIYVNVAGGIRLNDVGAELGLAMALYSACSDIALPAKTALCGEISLSGAIRQVSHIQQRISQALELGFSPIIVPGTSKKPGIVTVSNINLAIQSILRQE